MSEPLKVLIVDDSSLYRKILSSAVDALPMPTRLETAPSGMIALKKIPQFDPAVVLLDIEMPDMNGIEVLKAIRKENTEITVVLVSGTTSRSADITIEGLSSGAADFIPKPTGGSVDENVKALQQGLAEAFALAAARRLRRAERAQRPAPAGPAATAAAVPSLLPSRVEIVAIGISTGGPNALETMLPMLPASFPVPIAIVQHMPPLFTASLARSLSRNAKLTVVEAEEGMPLAGGGVYIAPGGKHLLIRREGTGLVARLDDGPPVNSCKPAVDVMFASLVPVTGKHTLAVVMTGMGADGAAGVAALKQVSAYCLTQSAETCTVYGMPHAVDQANLSDESVPLERMAARIVSIAGGAMGAAATR